MSQKKRLNRFAVLSGIGFQLAITVFLGAYLGRYLDDTCPISEKKIYTLIFTLACTALGMYNILRQINRLNKD